MSSLRFLPEQIEQWALARLKPYERNPRLHSDDQGRCSPHPAKLDTWTYKMYV